MRCGNDCQTENAKFISSWLSVTSLSSDRTELNLILSCGYIRDVINSFSSLSSKNSRPSGGSGHRDAAGGECSHAHRTMIWPLADTVRNHSNNNCRKPASSKIKKKLPVLDKSILASRRFYIKFANRSNNPISISS